MNESRTPAAKAADGLTDANLLNRLEAAAGELWAEAGATSTPDERFALAAEFALELLVHLEIGLDAYQPVLEFMAAKLLCVDVCRNVLSAAEKLTPAIEELLEPEPRPN